MAYLCYGLARVRSDHICSLLILPLFSCLQNAHKWLYMLSSDHVFVRLSHSQNAQNWRQMTFTNISTWWIIQRPQGSLKTLKKHRRQVKTYRVLANVKRVWWRVCCDKSQHAEGVSWSSTWYRPRKQSCSSRLSRPAVELVEQTVNWF